MLSNLLFSIRRALFVQPAALTRGVVQRRISRVFGTKAPANSDQHENIHPIDAHYGIDTGGVIKPSALRGNSKSDLFSVGYGGSQPSIVRRTLEMLPDLDSTIFIDIGCGKGRPLVVASEYPFRRIIGVELAASLCDTARANAARIAALHPERTPIEICEQDALQFVFPDGNLVLFIFHPFFDALFKPLVARIAAHAAQPGNRVLVIYINPACAWAFDELPAFSRVFAGNLGFDASESGAREFATSADSVAIWQTQSDAMVAPWPGADASITISKGYVAVVGDGNVTAER